MIDLYHIAERHEEAHRRLEEWAKWVRPRRMIAVHPMFRMYQSKARQWETDPHIKVEIDSIAAHRIEKIVSSLPDKHRTAIRWAYVFPFIHAGKVRRELGLTEQALAAMLDAARDMVKNRL